MNPDSSPSRGSHNGPIFIGGPDRCGKTTLQAFLSSHPRIAIPAVGSNLWSYFFGQYGDLHSRENFERCLDGLMHYKHARFLNPDPEKIRKEFWEGEPGYARLFALLHQHFASRAGKPRWGDQTGLIERYADQVMAAYPDAKMLHMIRDPRDRYAASLEMWPDGKGRVGAAAARWLYSARLAQRNLARYPGRYMIVRFEALILDPEAVLHQVCTFLGEEYSPAMLTMEGSPGHRMKLVQGYDGDPGAAVPLSPTHIGLYRQHIQKGEVEFIQRHTGKEMAAFEYLADRVRFSPPERLRYAAIDHPVNLARMSVWLARENLQQRYPVLFRRRPSRWMEIPHSRVEPSQESSR